MTNAANEELSARIRQALEANPRAMTLMLAQELNVPEAQVVSALPGGQSAELDCSRWEEIIRTFESIGKLHVICSNGAVTLEAFGEFGNFSRTGPFFNVQTASIDMHIRWQKLGSVFAVEKPGHMDGVKTLSIQFFDKPGTSAFKVFFSFGGKPAAPEREEKFRQIIETFRKAKS
ncbi:MAG TPA: ChuX/HutX family heme-like substrate-binding protein [Planctomycetota bacterium]|nr:ChuX/HutX family heme-like substrate-binding protein [Planctomycetota bacterium]